MTGFNSSQTVMATTLPEPNRPSLSSTPSSPQRAFSLKRGKHGEIGGGSRLSARGRYRDEPADAMPVVSPMSSYPAEEQDLTLDGAFTRTVRYVPVIQAGPAVCDKAAISGTNN